MKKKKRKKNSSLSQTDKPVRAYRTYGEGLVVNLLCRGDVLLVGVYADARVAACRNVVEQCGDVWACLV